MQLLVYMHPLLQVFVDAINAFFLQKFLHDITFSFSFFVPIKTIYVLKTYT